MPKYGRMEVNAYQRRMTIVSGEWPRDLSGAKPALPEADRSIAIFGQEPSALLGKKNNSRSAR